MEQAIEFEWAVRSSELDEYRSTLEDSGADLSPEAEPFTPPAGEEEDYTDAAFEPMLMLVGVLALSHLVRLVVDLLNKHGGLIIDVRTKRMSVREHPALPRGTVLVVGNEEAKRLDGPKQNEIADAIAALRA
jgi:hypothetical protein